MAENVRWYGEEYKRKFERHVRENLDRAAIVVTRNITGSFGNSGVTGKRSGATRQERAANRSQAGEPPHVDTGHLKRNIGWDRPAGRPLVRRVGTSMGNKESVGYAMWLEFGTRPHWIIASNADSLAFVGKDGNMVYREAVLHPGIAPRPFLRPGMAKSRPDIRKELTRPMT